MNILFKLCFFIMVFTRTLYLTAMKTDKSIKEYSQGSHFIRACSLKKNNNITSFSINEIQALFTWLRRNKIVHQSKEQQLLAYKLGHIICLYTQCSSTYKELLTTEKRKLLFDHADKMIAIGEFVDGRFWDCTDDEGIEIPIIIS